MQNKNKFFNFSGSFSYYCIKTFEQIVEINCTIKINKHFLPKLLQIESKLRSQEMSLNIGTTEHSMERHLVLTFKFVVSVKKYYSVSDRCICNSRQNNIFFRDFETTNLK